MNQSIPWVEKYRPKTFDTIILDENNETIIKTILDTNDFPNLLLFGPPGTGKTTTITNLIDVYQEQNGEKHKELVIHLNASDDRGIDILRNQIMMFINSKHLFNEGMKFVILDEVDYMTKTAQLALKYLIENNNENVRFCLICNYITKIDKTLQYEFVRLKFNKLPNHLIYNHLQDIVSKEKLSYSPLYINNIIDYYDSDIRSMINILQNNAYNNTEKLSYSREDIYKILFGILCDTNNTNNTNNSNNSNNNNESRFNKKCNYFLETYNIEKKDFFLRFFFFLVKQKINNMNKFLGFYEVLLKTNLYSSKFNVFFYKNVKKYI